MRHLENIVFLAYFALVYPPLWLYDRIRWGPPDKGTPASNCPHEQN